ncbi:MAG: hypothetical protein KME31_33700 [Tolypothrix carrinoi HA7290-LM1]|jgi:hypothetical protein|nr:hypothetical protein [Tolypothrix carrinoi HA7290-LM1]
MNNNIRCLKSEDAVTTIGQQVKFATFTQNSYLFAFLKKYWLNLVRWLLDNNKEIQVWQKSDRHGNIYWKAYDPITGKSFSSGSEADISIWIEQRYRK